MFLITKKRSLLRLGFIIIFPVSKAKKSARGPIVYSINSFCLVAWSFLLLVVSDIGVVYFDKKVGSFS
jgi:hypothetical protein